MQDFVVSFNRRRWGCALSLSLVLALSGPVLVCAGEASADRKPLFRDFMGINGHYTFKPELYGQVCRLARNYHSMNWDVKQPGDPITIPVCVNKVHWKNNVYGPWQKAGFETDLCLQFSGFEAGRSDYRALWTNQESWCFAYGKALAAYFGPSGAEKLVTSIEIGNEPGARFDQVLYRSIFQQIARGIRAADRQIKILTPAVQARSGDDYIQDLRGFYGDADILPLYDVINLHTYASVPRTNSSESPWNRSYPEDPAIDYLRVVDEAIAWRDKHAPNKEVWITEFGYDACTREAMKNRKDWFLKLDWQGYDDLQQAQYLVRSFLAFAERDVQRAYIYFYDDKDSPSVHGSSGLTRHFTPKMAFWAVKQLYELLGDYRFNKVVRKVSPQVCVYEFKHGRRANSRIWVAWTPTGCRTHQKDQHRPSALTITLDGLPSAPTDVVGMATREGEVPRPTWAKAGPSAMTLMVGESPAYILMR